MQQSDSLQCYGYLILIKLVPALIYEDCKVSQVHLQYQCLTCPALRPRGVMDVLALTYIRLLLSTKVTASALPINSISRLNNTAYQLSVLRLNLRSPFWLQGMDSGGRLTLTAQDSHLLYHKHFLGAPPFTIHCLFTALRQSFHCLLQKYCEIFAKILSLQSKFNRCF